MRNQPVIFIRAEGNLYPYPQPMEGLEILTPAGNGLTEIGGQRLYPVYIKAIQAFL